MSFVHLHTYSAYSLLQSTVKVEELVHQTKKLGMKSVALTDRNVMFASIPFFKECKKQGIKPIIGLTADIQHADGSYPIVLLAKNLDGYKNLLKISSAIKTKSPDGLPFRWLKGYSKGLIAITPGQEGSLETALLNGEPQKAVETVAVYKEIFGKDFYISVQKNGGRDEQSLFERVKVFACENECSIVATLPVHYLMKEDHIVHEAMLAIQTGQKLSDQDRKKLPSNEFYLKSPKEMHELFQDDPEVLENALFISSQCEVEIPLHQTLLPKYPHEKKISSQELLKQICLKGFHNRYGNADESYKKRLDYELDVIGQMNFSDYFLIVWDFMKYAREQGILTGPGRGSAAGSMVAYVLQITDIDPMRYNLLFERFLNPERVSMPDIDIDFPDNRRDEVIAYVASRYGELHVAQIITFGTFAAKAALRDSGRVFGLNSKELDSLSKLIPQRLGITIDQAIHESKQLQGFYQENDFNRKLIDTARKLEGLPRHTSTHAAGVVICDIALTEHIAIQEGHNGVHLTQFPMEVLEEIGLLKMDFLGLRNLTLLDSILEAIKKQTGRTVLLDRLPMEDVKTLQLLGNGDTTGIFQFESDGMRKVLMQLKPERFSDLVAVNALYRPGPMENIPVFIRRRHGEEKIQYPHPDLAPILENTYGVIVYQEQIMQIASRFAGFSLGQADLLRRAVSKKKKEVLDAGREDFVRGAINQGYEKNIAHTIYDLIVRFANYGFNLSHAAAYSLIAYQLAYLKAHFPLHFMTALLTSVIGNEDKIAQYTIQLKKMDIAFLPPSINRSNYSFRIEGQAIRFSLAAIKGIGGNVLKEIFKARKQKPFSDLFDFCLRVNTKVVNRKVLEVLVHSGAFDEFGEDRATLLASLDVAIEHVNLVNPNEDQFDLFEDSEFTLKPKYMKMDPIGIEDKLNYEKAVLGFYLSDHPVTPFTELFSHFGTASINQVLQQDEEPKSTLGIYITEAKSIRTKKGEVMAFLIVSDDSGEMEAVVFPNIYKEQMPLLKKGKVLLINGTLENRNGKKQLIVQKIYSIEELKRIQEENLKRLFIRIDKNVQSKSILPKLKQTIRHYPGFTSVLLYYERETRYVKLPMTEWINPTSQLLQQIQTLVGEKNVLLKDV
ncbi:DNA polymerase III subunit alpha [Peribacillus alkalitolerans]|uniref:DNA polymerase III subunit alpha n=1 Tax=Peribacillus alkalitolerans TaxID=1550385 RepID=UPI0013D7D1B3|nr:DNA polymerase III subunit alpha [Peribacillus alkalitolerans]